MNQHDLELLSAYLDGQLKPSDVTRLEARFQSDPQLVSVLNDLRATRNLLRKLPARRAPRNFTLTRKMVGQNPPLPRAFPIFRFATTLATLLFVFSFGVNSFGRQLAAQAPGFGRGGGGGAADSVAAPYAVESFATEAPAATEAPVLAPEAPALPAPTQTILPQAANGIQPTEPPATKMGDESALSQQSQLSTESEAEAPAPLIPSIWQIALAGIAIGSAVLMALIYQLSARRWK